MSQEINFPSYSYPVAPDILSNGAVVSLLELAPQSKIKLSDNAPTTIPPKINAEMNTGVISASAVAQLGFAGLLDFQASAEAYYLLSEVQMLLPAVKGREDSIIDKEYYGVGWRMCVKAWDLSSKTNLSIASIASQCTIKSSSSAVQFHMYGFENAALASLMPSMASTIGTFDIGAMQQLSIIQKALNDFMGTKDEELRTKMRPVLLGVDLKKNFTEPYDNSPSGVYAFHSIYDKYKYNDAIKKIPTNLEPGIEVKADLVSQVYDVLVGTNREVKPTDTQKSEAYKSVFKSSN